MSDFDKLFGFSMQIYLGAILLQLYWVVFGTFHYFNVRTKFWNMYGLPRMRGAKLILLWIVMLTPILNFAGALGVSMRVFQLWKLNREFKQLEKT